jgi:hypothetical protein
MYPGNYILIEICVETNSEGRVFQDNIHSVNGDCADIEKQLLHSSKTLLDLKKKTKCKCTTNN